MEENLQQELEQASAIYAMIVEFFVNYSFQILGAVVILIIGLLVARKIGNLVLNLCHKKNLDITLSRFIASTAKILVVVMVAIIALGKLGISVTPFLAAVGALSLGAGLAVQGLVSNYGAGLNIILTRPFIVGDTISVQGVSGRVKEVHLAYTILTNEDETEINIPNKHIVGEIIHNSFKNTLAEITIGIAYHEDPDVAIAHINRALQKITELSESKPPQVGIEAFGDSAVELGIRVWLPTEKYYSLLHSVNATIYQALKTNGVDIPFPQRHVTLLKESQAQ
ncbi:MAG: mechanosensitive ion channel protein MscS [Cellvibrionaceae bacterium]|nr:mechanosensitive ion channel protein MscS [Cellvibrionaceae bacterium]|tara:strand:+ start:12857 stop:13702 length:846 start_codon:yes stop_codon:yes gene_type:complete